MIDLVHPDPLRLEDGAPAVVFSPGGRRVVLRGTGCHGLLPGWRATLLYSGFAPLLVLQLVHEGGARAVWYLCSEGHRLGDRVDGLTPRDRTLLSRAAAPVLGEMVRALLQDPHPALGPAAQGLLELDEACRLDLMRLCRDRLAAGPLELLPLARTPELLLASPGDDAAPVALRRPHLRDLLSTDLQAMLPGIVASGRFVVPDPVDGTPVVSQGSLCIDDFHFAYRFVAAGGLVFYLIAGHEHSSVYALYLPRPGLLLCGPGQEGMAAGAQGFLPEALSHHLVVHGAAFAAYLGAPPTGLSVPLRAPPWSHIGHQLWNELSGIERVLGVVEEGAALPEWIVPDAERPVEFYGPIDTLFPRLAGHVRRGLLRDARELIGHAYANRRLVIRATDAFVSADLRRRLLAHAEAVAPDVPGLAQLDPEDGADTPWPVLLLGLRVENRTLTDLLGFYGRLITALRGRYPQARFVVDGHNVTAGGAKHRSYGEKAGQERAVAEAERAILEGLRSRHRTAVIVEAIGLTVPENLRLIERCDGFVSLWGAGLAKYRWACNKPGYVMTGRWNLEHRADLRIYELPTLLESPTELRWLAAEHVTDRPLDHPALVMPYPHGQWANFDIDEEAAIADIVAFVASLATDTGACGQDPADRVG